ncbi:hypothetical protein ACFQ6C_26475 [Streptomyces sp. NPDC056454]|uniref:hypothetical protein n=1 Tax=Streptomyces sp. NPDC056454 TaxID=3345823 RepID=UPI0036755222
MPKHPRRVARDSAKIDLTGVPMTPAMKALGQIRCAAGDLLDLEETLDALATDLVEIAWAQEGQIGKHILNVQGQPGNHRSYLYTRLNARGIGAKGSGWNSSRSRPPIEPAPVPDYLNEEDVADILRTVGELRKKIERIKGKRDEQYPQEHEERLALVERRAIANAN